MSSAILLIAVVWLVLLAPLLLLRSKQPVRRTSEALNETRVLISGDVNADDVDGFNARSLKRMPTMRTLRPAEASHVYSDDEVLELVDAEPEYVVFDDDDADRGSFPLSRWAQRLGRRDERDTPEVVDAEIVEDDAVAEGDAAVEDVEDDAAVEDSPVDEAPDETVDDEVDNEPAAKPRSGASFSHDETATGEFPAVTADTATEQEAADVDTVDLPVAYLRGGDVDTRVATDDEVEELQYARVDDDYLSSDLGELSNESSEVTEEDMAYVNSRRGRGVFDPVASQRVVKARMRRRAQILTGLIVLTILATIAGGIGGGSMWIAAAVMLAFTLLYLVALRRAHVEETRLRRRRLARMRRARLGVRNTEDAELGVPDRLRRPGAVIMEADDMDPEFQNFNYIDSRDFFDSDPERRDEQHARAV